MTSKKRITIMPKIRINHRLIANHDQPRALSRIDCDAGITPSEILRTVVFTKSVMVITHTIMQNRHSALIWNVVWYHSHMMNAVAAAKPMFAHTQNHFLNCAPAIIEAPIVTTIEKPTRPMNGF